MYATTSNSQSFDSLEMAEGMLIKYNDDLSEQNQLSYALSRIQTYDANIHVVNPLLGLFYVDSLKTHRTSPISYSKIFEHSNSHLDSSNNHVTCIREELEFRDKTQLELQNRLYQKEYLARLDIITGDIEVTKLNNQKIFYSVHKKFYWDRCSYEIILDILVKLKDVLHKENVFFFNNPWLRIGLDQMSYNKIRFHVRLDLNISRFGYTNEHFPWRYDKS
ncbi:hypothetical protein HHI36_024379 [Cryptolaemus montrouzieri]|uniref:Uncharacterized protein n=1 Tax=Cryptolaemus montrouzieri TaxID=559131 RepID=A0ABD2NYF1_9CUCU